MIRAENDEENCSKVRIFPIHEINADEMKELGVNPLGPEIHAGCSESRVTVEYNYNDCKFNEDGVENNASTSSEPKRPKLLSPNKFLYRRKILTNNLNTELNLSTLPDEILLAIVQYLPYKCLCRLSEVSRRMCTIATDDILWQKIDLAGRKLDTDWLMNILRRGIRVARLTGAEVISNLSTVPDEILLAVVQYLPYKCLCRLSEVSRRMYTIATVDILWQKIDLAGKKLDTDWLMNILRRGIRVVRLTGAEINSPLVTPTLAIELIDFQSRLELMDLSEAIISAQDLELLLSKCRMLRKLSLEACELSEGVCKEIAKNRSLDTLNLCMCTGITSAGISSILVNCQFLESLNVAWTLLDKAAILELVNHITPKIRKLNISGLRQAVKDKYVLKLIKRCEELVELDLSDCVEVSSTIITPILNDLSKLRTLSISRCYRINPSSLSELSTLPNFSRLNAFRIVSSEMMAREGLQNIKINRDFLSTVARPTVGIRKTTIWGIRCKE